MRKNIFILFSLLLPSFLLACTTAVVSGKYTEDGRPMLWKLRDTESFENKMAFFEDGKYDYIGLVNSNDSLGLQVWGGSNVMGFSIMNSASFNVNLDKESEIKDQEGFFMKKALQSCKNLADFEKLLKNTKKPMGLAAHFGVIDAEGGAAFYEVNNETFTKFDANDGATAPNGYILRTNYSFTGKKDVGYGFIRLQTAQDLFYMAESKGDLKAQTIMQDFSRSLKHAVLNKDFRTEYEQIPYGEHFINSGDFITRHGSSSNIVIVGVKKDDARDMSCIWNMVGFPNTCASLPVWPAGGKQMPQILLAGKNGNAPLNSMAMALKDKCYPIKRSAGYKYLQISELLNSQGNGIIQKLEILEKDIFSMTSEKEAIWKEKHPSIDEIQAYYQFLNEKVSTFYLNEWQLDAHKF